jgi:hypothetical protein
MSAALPEQAYTAAFETDAYSEFELCRDALDELFEAAAPTLRKQERDALRKEVFGWLDDLKRKNLEEAEKYKAQAQQAEGREKVILETLARSASSINALLHPPELPGDKTYGQFWREERERVSEQVLEELFTREEVAILTALLSREWHSHTTLSPEVRSHLAAIESLTKKLAALDHPDQSKGGNDGS